MPALQEILDSLAKGVNWPVVFYIAFGVLMLIALVRLANLSPPHIAIEIIKEIGEVLRGQVSRTAIDGAITLALIAFTAVVVLITLMHELPEILRFLNVGAETPDQFVYLIIFMVIATIITAILSLKITG
jgi:hypothetical protein